jgi:hypothetical protein
MTFIMAAVLSLGLWGCQGKVLNWLSRACDNWEESENIRAILKQDVLPLVQVGYTTYTNIARKDNTVGTALIFNNIDTALGFVGGLVDQACLTVKDLEAARYQASLAEAAKTELAGVAAVKNLK